MSLNTVYVCQKFFSNLVFTISHSISLILITFAMTILFIGVIAFVIQVVKTRAYLKKYLSKRLVIPKSLKTAISSLDLSGKVDVVKDPNKFSFCYGIFKPRICLSTGLMKSLKIDELKAVLLHESYHVKNRDPLKILLSQTASAMFFFIPLLAEIQSYYAFSKEIAADDVVVRGGNKQALISVLSKLFVSRSYSQAWLPALANGKDLEKRITHLTGRKGEIGFRPSTPNMVFSIIVMLFSFVIITTPLYAISTDSNGTNQSLFICHFNEDSMYTPAIFMSTQK